MSRDVDLDVDEPQADPGRQAAAKQPARGRRSLARTGAYLILVALAAFAIVPFSWLALAAFDRQASIFVKVPQTWTLSNFINLFVNEDGLRLIINSLIYSGGATLVLIVVATMAGYVLSRYSFPGRRTFMLGILLLRVIPPTAIIAPLYVIATGLGFLDTYYGVTLVLASWQLPLALWLMKGFFDTVPIQIEEAAWVDGATRLQAAFRVVLPLAGPGVGAAALIAFIGAWNEFLIPLVLISDPDKQPIALGLFRAYISYTQVDWGFLAALSVIYVIPAVVFYVVARRALQQSVAGGLAGT
ncbi:MAG TPA: carbohydrate ABC transporter permease [Actinomycetes bacterium]|jgi:multiple sugar transport system permease protein|nr:carbohydrate ABC transporter permease [Actinomycetes bacterium]